MNFKKLVRPVVVFWEGFEEGASELIFISQNINKNDRENLKLDLTESERIKQHWNNTGKYIRNSIEKYGEISREKVGSNKGGKEN